MKTYSEFFFRILGPDRACLDPELAYVFEMCSPQNRVVRAYAAPTLYLLSAHSRITLGELPDTELDAVAARLGVERPQQFEFADFDALRAHLLALPLSSDFEGFVLRDARRRRWKVKSPHYLSLHRLRFRGWIKATPELLLPFVLAQEQDELLAMVRTFHAEEPRTAAEIEDLLARISDINSAAFAKVKIQTQPAMKKKIK
jgi:hypothetical protein